MLNAMRNGNLPFDEFKHILARELKLEADKIVPEASFFTDLNIDSVCVVDTMLRLDDKGIDIPLELAWQIDTVEDAYQVMIYRGNN
jgi:acyl carrier protein